MRRLLNIGAVALIAVLSFSSFALISPLSFAQDTAPVEPNEESEQNSEEGEEAPEQPPEQDTEDPEVPDDTPAEEPELEQELESQAASCDNQEVTGLTVASVMQGNYCIVALKSGTGTWAVPEEVKKIDYLIVGGGGGGGQFGGGGAGAMYEAKSVVVVPSVPDLPSTIIATVGSGGLAGNSNAAGSGGTPTEFNGVTAYGGGGGSSSLQSKDATVHNAPSPGGSGGGAMASPTGREKRVTIDQSIDGVPSNNAGPTAPGIAAGTAGVGFRNKGGDSKPVFVFLSNAQWRNTITNVSGTGLYVSFWQGGGGGGAGAVGGNIVWQSNGLVGETAGVFNTVLEPGDGGSGRTSSLLSGETANTLEVGEVFDSAAYFAGGGGGMGNFDALTTEPKQWDFTRNTFLKYELRGKGGVGGGGGRDSVAAAKVNTGGGGSRAAGGSGVIVIRYLIPGLEPEEERSPGGSGVSGGDPRIGFDVSGSEGRVVEGTRVDMSGAGLPAGSEFFLRLYDPETVLAQGVVGGSGNFSQQFRLPGGLAPGTYTLEFSVTGVGMEPLGLHRVFVVSDQGTFVDAGVNVVGLKPGVVVPERLAYTGLSSSMLPWWALVVFVMGLALVLYSVRARRLVEALEAQGVQPVVRTPWEVLATPIRVPGIDYVPGSAGSTPAPVSLAESMRELDIAISRLLVRKMDSVQALWSRGF